MAIHEVSATFTRPADTDIYADADLVANHNTAGSVVPMSFSVGDTGAILVRVRIEKSDSDIVAANFNLHLYLDSPTVVNGDNGAFSTDVSGKIAIITPGIMVAGSDDDFIISNAGDAGMLNTIFIPQKVSSTVYGLLEAADTYTPASAEVFTVYLTYVN